MTTETTIDDKVRIEGRYWIMAPSWIHPEWVWVSECGTPFAQVEYLGPHCTSAVSCHEESFELMRQRAERHRSAMGPDYWLLLEGRSKPIGAECLNTDVVSREWTFKLSDGSIIQLTNNGMANATRRARIYWGEHGQDGSKEKS